MFRTFALSQDWTLAGKRISNSGYLLRFTHSDMTVPVAFYSEGKALIQGNPSVMRDILHQWWNEQRAQQALPLWETMSTDTVQIAEDNSVFPAIKEATFIPHIGSDEAGKGDYFGPLVVAGVYVNEQTLPQLIALGVRDSKQLSDTKILFLAQEIKTLCRGHGYILSYRPERYNKLYDKLSNLNHLLAKSHAQTIMKIQKNVTCTLAIVDQFGDEALVPTALHEMNCQISLQQRPRAEDDIVVATASIIARAEFLHQIEALSKSVGVLLPKSASDPDIITAGREVVAKHGRDMLRKVARLHFKTTKMILE